MDIIGTAQSGRAGFGLGDSWKAGKATLLERRQMGTSFVHEQEEEAGQAAEDEEDQLERTWLWTLTALNKFIAT